MAALFQGLLLDKSSGTRSNNEFVGIDNTKLTHFSKIQLVVYYQCCVLIVWAATRLCVIAH